MNKYHSSYLVFYKKKSSFFMEKNKISRKLVQLLFLISLSKWVNILNNFESYLRSGDWFLKRNEILVSVRG